MGFFTMKEKGQRINATRSKCQTIQFEQIYQTSLIFSYDSSTGVFTVPPGGDETYYFSTYLLSQFGEWGRFDIRLNDDIICTSFPDNYDSGPDFAAASCSAVVDVVARG